MARSGTAAKAASSSSSGHAESGLGCAENQIRKAVEGLHAANAVAVDALIRGLTRDAELAADVTQAVFAKALETLPENLQQVGPRPSEADAAKGRAWLFTVAPKRSDESAPPEGFGSPVGLESSRAGGGRVE